MEHKDSLEQFIISHRAAFDDKKAPAGVWAKLDKKDAPVHHLWKWSAIAASALLLMAIGYIIGDHMNAGNQTARWAEYQETEQFYQTRINQKMDEVKALPVSHEVLNDLQMLDEVYDELKKQLLADPNADANVLLMAMVKHQQQKLDVLEKIINKMNKYNKNENRNHEI
jgi:hypothetical protein